MEFTDRIGRRIKLHDIHVFIAVVQAGSMGKAAALLNTTQSAISRSIADLENTMGVRLLDRSPKGIEATQYGRALFKRSIAVFDELKQSVRDIEFLADPTTGEINIACSSAIALTFMPHVMERFVKNFPRAVLHFEEVASASATRNFPELRDRKYDLILTRGVSPQAREQAADDLNVETLFDDPLVIAAGAQSKWTARRRTLPERHLPQLPPSLRRFLGRFDRLRPSSQRRLPAGQSCSRRETLPGQESRAVPVREVQAWLRSGANRLTGSRAKIIAICVP